MLHVIHASALGAQPAAIEPQTTQIQELDQAAKARLASGDIPEADRIYTRLLSLTLDNPEAAMRYALAKWHLKQEYMAQSALLRLLRSGTPTAGNKLLIEKTLNKLYDGESVILMLRREGVAPLQDVERSWHAICDKMEALEAAGVPKEIGDYLSTLFENDPAQAYHALWQGYGMIYRQHYAGAEAALNLVLRAKTDRQTAEAARDGLRLVAELRAPGRSGGILDRIGSAAGGLSSAVEDQLAEQTIAQRLDQLEQHIKDRDFVAAAGLAAAVRAVPMDDETQGRYFYLLAENCWYQQEFFRANQSYVLASVLTRQRFILSAALIQMAEFALMSDDREDAAAYAARSASVLPDQDWKLRQVGGFFIGLGLPERGIAYLEDALEASTSPQGDAAAYAALAEAYNRIGEREQYLKYAADYVAAAARLGDSLGAEEDGRRFFFQAEILSAQGKGDAAYQAYEQASLRIDERFRLAEILTKMAEHQGASGNREQAVSLMERAAGLLPDQDWKLREAGNFLIRMGATAKGVELLERSLEHARLPKDRAASLARLAELYRERGEREKFLRAADEFASTVASGAYAPTAEETGLAAFYRGEAHAARGEADQAFAAYEEASRLVTDKYRLADVYMKMADHEARRGDAGRAAELAERSAAELPEEAWKLKQVSDFLLDLNLPDRAFPYLEQYAALEGAKDGAAAYAAMADAYSERNDQENYLKYAKEYIATVSAPGRTPTREEEGLSAFYLGGIRSAEGDADAAYQAYERAARLIADPGRLASIYMDMAERQARRGDREQAANLAEKSAAALPGEAWKLRQIGDFLLRLDMPDRAFAFFEQFAELSSPEDKAAVYAVMAEAYRDRGDRQRYLQNARAYVAAATAGDRPLSDAEKGQVAYYRAELLAANGNAKAAYTEYDKAAGLLTDQYRLSEIYMIMAEYQADEGNGQQAAALAERAALAMPDAAWRLRQIGELYDRLNMPEKAVAYFERWLQAGTSPGERAAAFSALAEIHKKMDDPEQYLRYARDYVAAVDTAGYAPSSDEKGWRFFYEGEILSAADEPDRAYRAYEQAAKLFTDKYRLSDIYIRMARYRAAKGDKEAAIELAERSLALLPDESWRVIEVGDLYNNLELPEKAVEQYRRAVEMAPKTGNRAAIYTSLAEVYKKLNDTAHYIEYARLYIDAIDTRGELSDNEKGLRAFYQGEILHSEGNDDAAYRSFEEASRLFTDKFRLSDIAMKQAEYHAKRENKAAAAEYAAQSAALLPDQAWRQRGVGDFFGNLEMMDQAIRYYERALELSRTPETRAAAFTSLAEAYKKTGDKERYIHYARQYVDAIGLRGGEASAYENGQRAYYQGEVYAAEGNDLLAYQAYEKALGIGSEDPYRLSELNIILSRYNVDWGNRPLAAEQATRAANLLPDQDWRVGEAVDILGKVGHFCVAEALVANAVILNADSNAHLYRKLSQQRLNAKDRKGALRYNAKFIDLQTEKVERLGCGATKDQREDLWNARDFQNGVSRTWGFDSYYFGRRWHDGNFFLGMSHELFRNYSLSNGMYGKFYIQYGGTLNALYSGRYFMNNETYNWKSRQNLGQTAHAVFGVNINPFKRLSSLSLNAEYYAGLGGNEKNDFRFRLGYDKTQGDKVRPTGNRWLYWKTYSNTSYSTRNNDITSLSDLRLGATFVSDRDRNLLFMPHATVGVTYGGKSVDKGARWGVDAGVGVAVRKWLRGGKYHTPRSYVDLQIYYQVGLTHDRKDGFGFTLSTSY